MARRFRYVAARRRDRFNQRGVPTATGRVIRFTWRRSHATLLVAMSAPLPAGLWFGGANMTCAIIALVAFVIGVLIGGAVVALAMNASGEQA
jgi:hypothetical protein